MSKAKNKEARRPDLPPPRIVAFLDILGFRDLITRMYEKQPKLFGLIRDVFSFTENEIRLANEAFYYKLKQLEISSFSDSIVISAPPDERFLVFLYVGSIANYYLKSGVALRGGIAVGSTYHKGNIVFGRGFISAYDLESKVAVYPRIVIDDSIVHQMNREDREFLASERNSLADKFYQSVDKQLRRDLDGCYFLDFIKPPFATISSPKREGIPKARELHYKEIKKAIERRLKLSKASGNQSIIAKDRWLVRYFNEALPTALRESVGLLKLDMEI